MDESIALALIVRLLILETIQLVIAFHNITCI